PELRCSGCRTQMQCAASESLMAILPDLPKPGAPAELVKSIGMLRERALITTKKLTDRKPQAAGSAVMPAVQARGSLAVPFLAAALAVILAAGGFLAYQRFTSK